MLKPGEEFVLPENFIKTQEDEIEQVEDGTYDGGGDLGSHYALFTGKNSDWIKLHAYMDPVLSANYARQLLCVLSGCGITPKGLAVLDVGCGPGTVTNAIRRSLKGGIVTGVDISKYAIAYAREKYPDCIFLHSAVGERTVFPQKYHLIHAREFYPFTRTSDSQTHLNYLSLFSRYLDDNGIIVLCLVVSAECIANTYIGIGAGLSAMRLGPIIRKLMASNKIGKLIPLAISIKLTGLAQKICKKEPSYFYITKKVG